MLDPSLWNGAVATDYFKSSRGKRGEKIYSNVTGFVLSAHLQLPHNINAAEIARSSPIQEFVWFRPTTRRACNACGEYHADREAVRAITSKPRCKFSYDQVWAFVRNVWRRREEIRDLMWRRREEIRDLMFGSYMRNCPQLAVFSTPEERLLSQHNIRTKRELRSWLLVHHPDKGGDSDLCAAVMQAAKKRKLQ